MSLIVDKVPSLEVVVKYELLPNGDIKYHEGDTPTNENIKEEKFLFRRPTWADTRVMAKAARKVDEAGKVFVDPWSFMDVRIKTLLCDWTIKDAKGGKMPVSAPAIDSLHPSLLTHLSEKLDALESNTK